jgi:hypothetical protein
MANIGRKTKTGEQNMHHFMSNSPWSGPDLVNVIQAKVKERAEFQAGAMLLSTKALMRKRVSSVPGPGDNTMGGWARSN